MRGGAVVTIRHFARVLGPDQPVYGLWAPWMHGAADDGRSIEEIAAACVTAMRREVADGPYVLFGYSFGGAVMYEVARQLADAGVPAELLVIADAVHASVLWREYRRRRTVRYRARKVFSRRLPGIVAFRVRQAIGRARPKPVSVRAGDRRAAGLGRHLRPRTRLCRRSRGRAGGHPLHGCLPRPRPHARPRLGATCSARNGTAHRVPGDHNSMIGEPHVDVLAARLATAIDRVVLDMTASSAST